MPESNTDPSAAAAGKSIDGVVGFRLLVLILEAVPGLHRSGTGASNSL